MNDRNLRQSELIAGVPAQAGFTLIELLVGMTLLTLLLVIATTVLIPVMNYVSAGQAKANTQSNAVPLLYKLQKDVRQSDYRAVFIDQSGAQPLPGPTATPADVTVFAVASARQNADGDACFPRAAFTTVSGFGSPNWHGFEVFDLRSTNNTLTCVYETASFSGCDPPSPPAPPCQSAANTAITKGKAVTTASVYGAAVLDIKMKADATLPVVDFTIKALSTVNGRTNATTYTNDILSRN
ncbi:MAG: prepilin-type N-terminal cleavage/methylation domain-containing protein [Candidatus Eremiobacteraeota bacterium]|nr:prepilin-type N-terminal cleavage/methylation domain-containing protein [Candidatus Eremiobacteraeota bacterium]MBC5827232.1 prepilin-type N-terminal cleavage/methylation domain-containing protein [Candidatus Eremiobacteraeota bacterium]